MSNYIIDQMTWSYSRLHAYLDCPYSFYLKYIDGTEEDPMWYSSYGSFVHQILAEYFKGEITRNDAVTRYLTGFYSIPGARPNQSVFMNYYEQGLEHMRNLTPFVESIIGVEKKVFFKIDGFKFVGVIDLLLQHDDGIVILDHKSHMLKPRSGRAKPTKTDQELDAYLRQLYLYSAPIIDKYGQKPSLAFNCFRSGMIINEPFKDEDFESAKNWALDTIHAIEEEKDWNPNADWFYCHNLCGLRSQCEYAQMNMV